MSVHKIDKSGMPKDPERPQVRRIGSGAGAPSRERVRELLDSGFFSRSAVQSYLADPERDPLPPRPKS